MLGKNRICIAMSLVLAVAYAGGCDGRRTESESQTPANAAPETKPDSDCVATWQAGKADAAVEQFVSTDWSTVRPEGSLLVLSITEARYSALRTDERARADRSVATLKELVRAVLQRGDEAEAHGDATLAKKHYASVRAAGKRFSQDGGLAALKMLGQAIEKKAKTKPE